MAALALESENKPFPGRERTKAEKQMARLCRRLGSKPALQRRTGDELGLFELGLKKVRSVVLGRDNEEEEE